MTSSPKHDRRLLSRLSVVFAALGVAICFSPLAAMASVSTLGVDIGDKGSTQSLSTADFLGLFVAIPLGVFLLVVLIIMRPGTGGSARYRPTSGWKAEDTWFGEKPAETSEVTAGDVPDTGGGSRASW